MSPVTVTFIKPMRKNPEETAVQFSERVKEKISNAAGLKNLSWDGYLKNYRPSREKQDKMRLETRQEYLKELSKKLNKSAKISSEEISGFESFNESEQTYYLPEWLNDYERTILQNKLLQDFSCNQRPIPIKRRNSNDRKIQSKLNELNESFNLKPSSI